MIAAAMATDQHAQLEIIKTVPMEYGSTKHLAHKRLFGGQIYENAGSFISKIYKRKKNNQ